MSFDILDFVHIYCAQIFNKIRTCNKSKSNHIYQVLMIKKNSFEDVKNEEKEMMSSILKDPQSSLANIMGLAAPLMYLDEHQQLFLNDKLHNLPLKTGVTNMCTSNSQNNQQVCYKCFTCKRLEDHSDDEVYIICQRCFIEEQHQGHYYQVTSFQPGYYCQCGKQLGDSNEQPIFCCGRAHSLLQSSQNIQESSQELKEFTQHLFPLIQFWNQCSKIQKLASYTEILNKTICKSLTKLCVGSPYYISYFGDLLFKKPQKFDDYSSLLEYLIIIEFFDKDLRQGQQFLLALCEDNKFSKTLCQKIHCFSDYERWISIRLLTQLHHLTQNIVIMAKNKFLNQQMQTQYIDACIRMKNDDILFEYLNKNFKGPAMFMNAIFSLMVKEERPWYMSQRSIKHYLPRVLKIIKYVNQKNKEAQQSENGEEQEIQNNASAENKESKQEQAPKENQQNQSEKQLVKEDVEMPLSQILEDNSKEPQLPEEGEYPNCLQMHQLIETVKMICYYLKWDPKRIANATQELKKLQIAPKYLRSFLRPCLQNLSNFPGLQQFVQILIMLTTDKIRTQFTKVMQEIDFEDFFPFALIIVKVIANYDFFFEEKQYECLEEEKKKEKKEQNDKKRNSILKEIVINNKTVSFGFFLANKKKWFNTDLNSIREIVTFDKQNQRLEYNESGHKQNPLRRLFLHHRGNDYYKKLAPKGNRYQVNEGQRFLIDIMIKKFCLSNMLKTKYNLLVKEVEGNQYKIRKFQDLEYAQHYIQWLIWIDSFTEGQDQIAKTELEKMSQDADYRFPFEFMGDKEIIQRLLNIDHKEEKEDENANKQVNNAGNNGLVHEIQNLNEKFESKKKKLADKFKKKRNNFFQNLASNSLRTFSIGQGEQQCIICHEKEKRSKPVGYLVEVIKKKTISSVFFEGNKTETLVKSCFHCIHAQCYHKSIRKGNGRCPLCSKNTNGIIPMRFDKDQEKFNRICFTMISSAMVDAYDVLDIHSLFWVFFEHLIQSRGLDAFIHPDMYQERRRRKERLDVFLEDMLQSIYESAEQEIRKQYDQLINRFVKQVEKLQNQPIKLLQLIVTEALSNKIKNDKVEFDQQKLRRLQEILIEEDYKIIKNELEDLGADQNYCTNFPVSEYARAGAPEKKIKLSHGFPKLPQYASEIEKFGGKQCSKCNSKIREIKCLICLQSFCEKCWRASEHSQKHVWKLFFNLKFGEMQGRTNNKNIDVFLYRNQMNNPLRDISYPLSHKDTFKLDYEIIREIEKAYYEQD